MQYFGKGPGFVEPWLSTKTAGGGGGGGGGGGVFEIQELRCDSPKWRSDSNLMLHNRSNLSNPTGPQQKKDANHILIPQVICFFISVSKLLTFWYRYEKTDHL